MKKIIIAAVSHNNIIGAAGKIPWQIKGELQHFKETTIGYPVIMGRKTFESLLNPLHGRINIVISRDPGLFMSYDEVKYVDSLSEAYKFCKRLCFTTVFIIGGGMVFKEAIKDADEMIISYIPQKFEGDTVFPPISKTKWKLISKEKKEGFEIRRYQRKLN